MAFPSVSKTMQASGTKWVSSNVRRSRCLFWGYPSLGINMSSAPDASKDQVCYFQHNREQPEVEGEVVPE